MTTLPLPGTPLPGKPLSGTTVIELAGLGPAPFAAMLLAELGADVIRVERPAANIFFRGRETDDLTNRGKRSFAVDLKQPGAVDLVLELVERADILIEGNRPGVAERLGLGPEQCHARNPRLVYGRMTGWGQDGPLSQSAGHDINYIALTGALHAIGTPADPIPPLNLVGDFGGGSLYLVVGLLAALNAARTGVERQVVDAAIVDGTAHLLTAIHAFLAADSWVERRGENLLDGGRPYYTTYRTSDGRHMAVGCLEPQFYAEFVRLLEVDLDPADQMNADTWPAARVAIAARFATATMAEWSARFDGTDACVTPVLSLTEAAASPHLRARGTLQESPLQAAPAPRFAGVRPSVPTPPPAPGAHTLEILAELGHAPEQLVREGVVFTPQTRAGR
ncbi:CaiB/BaiF CoA transferase family protein [Granulicoccus phenolivorans]|uniref:CaiB/BaiF CoA transferase family protein n=1 Tax=Granulicoccus phenolivorans TaxID=266854 RepID=UPI00040F420A|nr:CaiB/BaiF CoA-transferase family protein [Granulicoccus phenolivorans]